MHNPFLEFQLLSKASKEERLREEKEKELKSCGSCSPLQAPNQPAESCVSESYIRSQEPAGRKEGQNTEPALDPDLSSGSAMSDYYSVT